MFKPAPSLILECPYAHPDCGMALVMTLRHNMGDRMEKYGRLSFHTDLSMP